MSLYGSARTNTVIVRHTGNQGLLAGLLGCLFGLLGIFAWGIIFVPLAVICSLVGLLRGSFALSAKRDRVLAAWLHVEYLGRRGVTQSLGRHRIRAPRPAFSGRIGAGAVCRD
jgi:hypothetical protein